MPLPTAILFTCALLVAVLLAIGWSLDATAPTITEWFVAKAGEGGLWTGLMVFLVVVAIAAWRGRGATRP